MEENLKQLLLKYLCTALPYEVIIEYNNDSCVETREMGLGSLHDFMFDNAEIKPYLRPISSMTEEEKVQLCQYACIGEDLNGEFIDEVQRKDCAAYIDWLNSHHFDYRGLIEKGLAIEVNDSNNPYK